MDAVAYTFVRNVFAHSCAVLGPRSEALKLGFDAYLNNYQAVTKPVTRAMARENSGEQIKKNPLFPGV
jgi:hypothetical protein